MLILARSSTRITALLTLPPDRLRVVYTLWLKRATRRTSSSRRGRCRPASAGWAAVTNTIDPHALLLS